MTKILLVSRCAWTLFNFREGLMRRLKAGGYAVIGAGAAGDGFEPKVEALGVPFHALPVDKRALNPAADLKLFWTLYRWYRREKPDVVHHFTIKPVIYGSLAARLAGVPRIVNTITGLGFVFTSEASGWLRWLVELQYRAALACAHRTFFLNTDDMNLFLERRLVAPEKADLLPESVDTTVFAPIAPTVNSTSDGAARNGNTEQATKADPTAVASVSFLMAARLLQNKGVYEFAEAARLVKQTFPQARFQLLGGRDERSPIVVPEADLAAWRREGIVDWLGEVSDVRPYIAQADVVVLPSYYREGMPRTLLEGAAMGKALITTDNVGCRDVVRDGFNGLLVPVRDAPALAGAMRRLIEDPDLRARLGAAGRERAVREFDEAVIVAKVVESYTSNVPPSLPPLPA